jgi:predicted RNA binding protein YcfA (HicA-like mRNA interferase family)
MYSGGRRLRNVRAQRAIRAFHNLGYDTTRIRGSHHVLKHPSKDQIVLPVHRGTIKVGILVDAVKKAGITIEEFERLL